MRVQIYMKSYLLILVNLVTALFYIKKTFSTNVMNLQKRSAVVYDSAHYSIIPIEVYKNSELEIMTIYDLIFDKIKFQNEYCNFAFQNCMANTVNNLDIINRVSNECFPLKKSKHCLHKANFVESDCNFKTIHDKAKAFQLVLAKNFEACNSVFPLNLKSDYSKSLNSSTNRKCFYSFRFLVYFILLSIFVKLFIFV